MLRWTSFAAAVLALLVPSNALGGTVEPSPIQSVGFDGPVEAAVQHGGVIYLGGRFTHAYSDGAEVQRDRLAAVDARTGRLLDWAPSANGSVLALAVDESGLYAVGDFTAVDGQGRDSLAKLDLAGGRLIPGFQQRISGRVKAVAAGGGRIYAGGTITAVNGQARTGAAGFDAADGRPDPGWVPALQGAVSALLATPERVYAGGSFTGKLAALRPDTGEVDASFKSPVSATVYSILVSGGVLYAGIDGDGGRVTAMALDGGPMWTVRTDGDVAALAYLDGVLYVGGHFDNVCRSDRLGPLAGKRGSRCLDGSDRRVKLAAFGAGGALLPWVADTDGSVGVRTLAADPQLGRIAVGGYFTGRFRLFSSP
jgi:outer membrane protein assembly factor BamB